MSICETNKWATDANLFHYYWSLDRYCEDGKRETMKQMTKRSERNSKSCYESFPSSSFERHRLELRLDVKVRTPNSTRPENQFACCEHEKPSIRRRRHLEHSDFQLQFIRQTRWAIIAESLHNSKFSDVFPIEFNSFSLSIIQAFSLFLLFCVDEKRNWKVYEAQKWFIHDEGALTFSPVTVEIRAAGELELVALNLSEKNPLDYRRQFWNRSRWCCQSSRCRNSSRDALETDSIFSGVTFETKVNE